MKTLIKITLIIFLIIPFNSFSQKGVIINNSAYLSLSGDINLKVGDDLDFVNNSSNNQFGGNIIFAGNSLQTISGSQESYFENLEIDNSDGVSLENNISVSNELILTDGILNLNDYFMMIGESASVSGSFSSSSMINADGTGMLIREINSTGTYLFPIGDITSGNDYSPAEITINSGDFSSSELRINLKNEKHPNNPVSNDFLNRYWTVESSGITNFNSDVVFSYVPGDINGLENNIYGALWDGVTWSQLDNCSSYEITGLVSNFGDITGANESVFSDINNIQNFDIILYYAEGNIIIENNSNNLISDIKIFAIDGKLLKEYIPHSKTNYIPFNQYSSGLYIISLKTDKNIILKKLFM